MRSNIDIDGAIRSAYAAMPIPAFTPRVRSAAYGRGVLAVAAALALAVLVVAAQVEPLRSAAGAALEELARRVAPRSVVEPSSSPSPSPSSPTASPSSPTASEVLFRARQVLTTCTAGKARQIHQGAPFGINREYVLPRGTAYVTESRSQCPDRWSGVTISSSTGLYEERIVIGSTVYVRSAPDGAWVVYTVVNSVSGSEAAEYTLGYGGGYRTMRERGVLGPSVTCGAEQCFTHITEGGGAFNPDRVVGVARSTLLIEQRTGRLVEQRIHVDWPDGSTTDDLVEYFDFDVPNVIEPPQ